MKEVEKGLSIDYREFDEFLDGISLSKSIQDPVARISLEEGRYRLQVGCKIGRLDVVNFVSAPSVRHNWIIDSGRGLIRPLPFDTPKLIEKILQGAAADNLVFADVIRISRWTGDGIEVEISEDVLEKANAKAETRELDNVVPGLKAELFAYQNHGVAWMLDTLKTTGGLILADEMGLGKTIQIIALFLLHPPSNQHPALIVCPTTLIANWCRELGKFSPSITYLVHRGSNRSGYYKDFMRSQVVITTYDTLTNDISAIIGVDWSYLVCDEAQAAKNPLSQRRRALARVPRKFTIPVTGTPVETSLLDLWSLTDLAIPGLLGPLENFSSLYPDSESGAADLAKVTDPVVLKRQVRDVANDLPERTDIELPIEMDEKGATEYERVRQEVLDEYGMAGQLVAVGQLSLFSAHAWLRAKNFLDPNWEESIELRKDPAYPLITRKMEVCLNILKEAFLTKKKVLIFATYNLCGDLICRASVQGGLPTAYWNKINGLTPQSDRQSIVDEFSKYDGPGVLILNPKAAGAGLNITCATIVIHYTQNWNPALEMQASARAHRRGQDQPVTVYKLFYQDTVEETMVQRSAWRVRLGNQAVPIDSTRDNQDFKNALSISPIK